VFPRRSSFKNISNVGTQPTPHHPPPPPPPPVGLCRSLNELFYSVHARDMKDCPPAKVNHRPLHPRGKQAPFSLYAFHQTLSSRRVWLSLSDLPPCSFSAGTVRYSTCQAPSPGVLLNLHQRIVPRPSSFPNIII